MEIIGQSGNTIFDSYKHYFGDNMCIVRIDAQITQDKKIAIYDQDASMKRMKHLLRENILTLDEYLRHIPQDLTIVIDITRKYGGKQNNLPNDVACRLIMATKKRGKKNVIYASSDKAIATIIIKNRREAMLIVNDESELNNLDIFQKICVDKSLLNHTLDPYFSSKEIYVKDLENLSELETYKNNFSHIKGGFIKSTKSGN